MNKKIRIKTNKRRIKNLERGWMHEDKNERKIKEEVEIIKKNKKGWDKERRFKK